LGGRELRFAILTTAANSSMAEIHHRQPVIIPPLMIRPWINDPQAADELRQSPGPQMTRSLIK
jgi:putative SOS response-associated peptidase YedK